LISLIAEAGAQIPYAEHGNVREDLRGHEQFGFDDGISQPGIRGRASNQTDDFVTPRHITENAQPMASLFGYPGHDPVWPGVLLLASLHEP
jgi:hypothetical protein